MMGKAIGGIDHKCLNFTMRGLAVFPVAFDVAGRAVVDQFLRLCSAAHPKLLRTSPIGLNTVTRHSRIAESGAKIGVISQMRSGAGVRAAPAKLRSKRSSRAV